jgi:plasmid maintenance system killer protein
MKNIATALVKAQRAFEPAFKTANNPHFRSKYADLSACIDAVKEALNDNGIYLLQKNYDCADGVMLETVFIHESGEMLETGIVHFPANKHDPQGHASALTYARRYSLLSACGIAPESEKQTVSFADDDGNAASKKPKANEKALTDHLSAIDATSNSEELTAAYQAAFEACNGDQAWQAKVMAAKKSRVDRAKKEKTNG